MWGKAMKRKGFQILKHFLKEEVSNMMVYILFLMIMVLVKYLYNIQMEAIIYTCILCLFLGVIVLGIRYAGYYKRTKERILSLQNLSSGDVALPCPHTLEEEDYQEVISSLSKQLEDCISSWENKRMEHIDYYTTWIHQIKIPISVMGMILQGEDTKEHRQLQAELFRIEQYVEMVLSYIRLGSTTNDFVFRKCNIGEIVKQAVHKYAGQFVEKRLCLHFEAKDIYTVTDEKWLGFIIEQILSNAIKYTREGEITIEIGEDKILSIQDTGIGIAGEDLPRIFEKGFTGYNGREDKKSTGLGMYLCKQAADRLGIRLYAESRPGEGSCFYLDLNNKELDVG